MLAQSHANGNGVGVIDADDDTLSEADTEADNDAEAECVCDADSDTLIVSETDGDRASLVSSLELPSFGLEDGVFDAFADLDGLRVLLADRSDERDFFGVREAVLVFVLLSV